MAALATCSAPLLTSATMHINAWLIPRTITNDKPAPAKTAANKATQIRYRNRASWACASALFRTPSARLYSVSEPIACLATSYAGAASATYFL